MGNQSAQECIDSKKTPLQWVSLLRHLMHLNLVPTLKKLTPLPYLNLMTSSVELLHGLYIRPVLTLEQRV